MIQKATDFKKKKGSLLVMSTDDSYLHQIRKARDDDRRFKDINIRLDNLEKQVQQLANLLRAQVCG